MVAKTTSDTGVGRQVRNMPPACGRPIWRWPRRSRAGSTVRHGCPPTTSQGERRAPCARTGALRVTPVGESCGTWLLMASGEAAWAGRFLAPTTAVPAAECSVQLPPGPPPVAVAPPARPTGDRARGPVGRGALAGAARNRGGRKILGDRHDESFAGRGSESAKQHWSAASPARGP